MKALAVAVFGPTGVGKTSISLDIAENTGEIISVDSRQVYKYMDVGTAKPSESQLKQVKHHLIDIITPDKRFTVADFKNQAEVLINEIINRKKIPFLVGGTAMYFNALFSGIVDIPQISEKTKSFLEKKWNEEGQEFLYDLLKEKDPVYSNKIHSNDKQRTLRALEVFFDTGKTFSDFLKTDNVKNDFQYLKICINIDREIVYKRINDRVDEMISSGLVSEVKKLMELGYDEKSPGMSGIGYSEILEHLSGKISLDEAIYKIKLNSRHYAKRQLTWFRSFDDVKWFSNDQKDDIKKYIFEKIGE